MVEHPCWNVIVRFFPTNDKGNLNAGDVVTVDTTNCIVRDSKRLISMIGLDNLIIADVRDTLLLCKREDAHKIEKVLKVLHVTNCFNSK